MQDLFSTYPTLETCLRSSCRLYGSHPATRAISYRSYRPGMNLSALEDIDHQGIDYVSEVIISCFGQHIEERHAHETTQKRPCNATHRTRAAKMDAAAGILEGSLEAVRRQVLGVAELAFSPTLSNTKGTPINKSRKLALGWVGQ